MYLYFNKCFILNGEVGTQETMHTKISVNEYDLGQIECTSHYKFLYHFRTLVENEHNVVIMLSYHTTKHCPQL